MIEDAERLIARLASDAVGVIFIDGDKPVQPDVTMLDTCRRNPGAPSGWWPSSPDITHAMLERYGKPKARPALRKSRILQHRKAGNRVCRIPLMFMEVESPKNVRCVFIRLLQAGKASGPIWVRQSGASR